jgi:hypothetical protein
MGRRAEYTIAVTNPSGTTVMCDPVGAGDPATSKPGWKSISLKPRHNVVGYGEFTVSALPGLVAAVNTPENRIVVFREPDGGGTPAQASTGQTTTARYAIAAVNPETAIINLANLNAGPGALAARRMAGLTIAAPAGLFPAVTISTSFTRDVILTDAIRECSRLAGALGIGFRIVQVSGGGRQFQTFAPRDLSGAVVFSRDLGNVATLSYEPTAPTCTVALVGDATAGTGRVVRERINTAAITAGWARREIWVDGSGAANAGEMDQLGDKALTDGAATYKVAVTAIETPDCRWAYDFGPGDQVSVEVSPGAFVTALVQGADIDVTPDKGESISPVIATAADSLLPQQAAEIRKIWSVIAANASAV